jgi:hypothetical protein
VRLVTWSAGTDIKAAPVFVSFSSYISYSHLFFIPKLSGLGGVIALASLSKNQMFTTDVPGVFQKLNLHLSCSVLSSQQKRPPS